MTQDSNYWKDRPLDDPELDWRNGETNWVEGYVKSVDHPHRQLILDALEGLKKGELWRYILEIGCNTGANLLKIHKAYPDLLLGGIDPSGLALAQARRLLPMGQFKKGVVTKIPFSDSEWNVTICDATLLYVGPEEIEQALKEIDRVTRQTVILVERYAESLEGEVVGHVWGRNYKALFERMGYNVTEIPLTQDTWPTSKNWQKYGRLYICKK